MRTPAQALRDAIASGAVEAWHRGGKICLSHAETIHWNVWSFSDKELPQFNNPDLIWRPAPAKRRIPFTQATVPKWALWRFEDSNRWFIASEYMWEGISCGTNLSVTYAELVSKEYSTDGGATWHPGSLEVES